MKNQTEEVTVTLRWGFPLNRNKMHLFVMGRALCRKHLLFAGGGRPFAPRAARSQKECAHCYRLAHRKDRPK